MEKRNTSHWLRWMKCSLARFSTFNALVIVFVVGRRHRRCSPWGCCSMTRSKSPYKTSTGCHNLSLLLEENPRELNGNIQLDDYVLSFVSSFTSASLMMFLEFVYFFCPQNVFNRAQTRLFWMNYSLKKIWTNAKVDSVALHRKRTKSENAKRRRNKPGKPEKDAMILFG